MKKSYLTIALSIALFSAVGMACSKTTQPEKSDQPAAAPTAVDEGAQSDDAVKSDDAAKTADNSGQNMFMPPFGNSYKRDILEVCDNDKDDDGDGKTDCDDPKCVGSVSCIASEAPTVDEASCVTIDLANPNSNSFEVLVNDAIKALTININGDEKACVRLTGAYDGRVIISNRKNVDMDVILDNIKITSEKSAGALKLNTAKKKKGNHFVLKLVGDNHIEGAGVDSSKNVLDCEANLDVIGDGSLTVVSRYKNAVSVDDVIRVWSGNIDVRVERDNKDASLKEKGFGMKIKNGFIQSGGVIKVTGRDSLLGYESRGIKVDGSESSYGAGKGYVIITGGELTIDTDAKALSADWSISDAKTESTNDDPYPDLTITGGKVYVHTYTQPRESRSMGGPGGPGMPPGFKNASPSDFKDMDLNRVPPEIAEAIRAFRDGETETLVIPPPPGMDSEPLKHADGSEIASVSPEGLEAKGHMFLKGGEIVSIATDDGINAGGQLVISGGTIFVRSTDNDAIDSNGTIHISGGTTIAFGSSEPEGGLDADFSTNVSYSGGTVFAMGGENNAPGKVEGDGSFVQYDLVEKDQRGGMRGHGGSNDGSGGMHGHGGPGGMHGHGGPGGMHGHGGPGGMHGHGGPGHRQKTKSVLAGKIIAVAAKDSDKVIAAAKVPEDYMGGGNLLVINDSLRKDADYLIYPDASLTGADKWFNDAMLMSDASASGADPKEAKGGAATAGHMGGPGMGMGRHGGHGSEEMPGNNGMPGQNDKSINPKGNL